MNTNERELICKEEVFAITGCAMQVLNTLGHDYLKITGLQIGLILNFKHPQLEWKRIVLSHSCSFASIGGSNLSNS